MSACRFTPKELTDENRKSVHKAVMKHIKVSDFNTLEHGTNSSRYTNVEGAKMPFILEAVTRKNAIYQSLDGNYNMDYITAEIKGKDVVIKYKNHNVLAKNVNKYNTNIRNVKKKASKSAIDKIINILSGIQDNLTSKQIAELEALKETGEPRVLRELSNIMKLVPIMQSVESQDRAAIEEHKKAVLKKAGLNIKDNAETEVNKKAPEEFRGNTPEETVDNVYAQAEKQDIDEAEEAYIQESLDQEPDIKDAVNKSKSSSNTFDTRIEPNANRKRIRSFDTNTPIEVFHALVRARNQYAKQIKTFTNNLQNRIAVLEANVRDYNGDDHKQELIEAQQLFNKLKVLWFGKQDIDKMDANNFMDTILEEIDILEKEIADGRNINSIFSRMDLLKSLLNGEGIDGNSIEGNLKFVNEGALNDVRDRFAKVEAEFVKLANKTVIESLMSSEIFRRNMSDMGLKDVSEVIKLVTAKGDLSMMEQLFKGISFSDSDVGVMPEMMKIMFHKVQVRHLAEAEQQKVKLQKAAEKVGSDTEFAREKDINGNYTGNLIQPFRSVWAKLMATPRNPEAKKKLYNQIAEKIEYAKIPTLKDMFGTMYPNEFKYSDEQMQAYDNYLKEKLGDHYDTIIENSKKKIMAYNRQALIDKNAKEVSPFQKVQGGGEIEFMEFIPKQEHHWNRDYNNLTPEQKEYVQTIVSINKSYISPNVEGYGEMSYGKFFLGMIDAVKNQKGFGKKTKTVIKHALKLFYTNKDALTGNRIHSNYRDDFEGFKRNVEHHLGNMTTEQVYNYGKDVGLNFENMLKGRKGRITKQEMIEYIANALYKSELETDITSTTERMIDIASNNATRHEMLPVAQNYFRFFALHNGSKTGIQRSMRAFINQVIRGLRDKDLDVFQKILATNIKLEDINSLEDIRKIVLTNKKLTENDKTVLDLIRKAVETDLSETSVRFNGIEGDKFSNNYKQVEPGVYGDMEYYKNDVKISKEEYEAEYAKHLADELNKTGIPMTIGSVFRGLNSIILHKYLGLSPFSGIINRWQGMNDNGLADIHGHYWTSGNLAKSQKFLNLANTIIYGMDKSKSRLAVINRFLPEKKVNEMNKLKKLTKMLGLNVFVDEKGLSHHLMSWSIKNPEFKNQMEIFLSILQDMKIKDIHGNEHQMFDGEQLVAYDMVDGTLQLKPEFVTDENVEMYEKFKDGKNGYNPMGEFVAKHAKAVSHIQNNFDNYDITSTTNNLFLSMFSMLKKWIVSGYMQRFDAGQGRDLTFNKKKKEGRYITAMRNPTSGLSFVAGNMFIALGLGASASFLTVFGAGAGAIYLGYKMYMRKKFQQDIKTNAFNVQELGLFWSSVVLSAIDFPVRMIAGRSLGFHNRNLGIGNLTPEEAGNIRALGMELGNKMALLAMSLGALALLYDDDDDEESAKRRFYNYMANRLAQLVYDNAIYHNPEQFVESVNRVGIVDFTKNLFELTTLLYRSDQVTDAKVERMINKAIPLPTTITNIIMRGSPFTSDVRIGTEQLDDIVMPTERLYQKKLRILSENINHEVRSVITNRKTISLMKKRIIGQRGNKSYEQFYKKIKPIVDNTNFKERAKRYRSLDRTFNMRDKAKKKIQSS